MKKKIKGFTLIELLAIIVILAIIAVITIPLILNVIENGKLGATQDSSYGYKDAIEKFILEKMGENYNFKLEDKIYTTEELKNLGLKISGQEPNSGEIEIEKNIVKSFTLQYDEYTCVYPVNNKVECEIGNGLKIKNINLESTSNSITVTTTTKGNVTEYLYKVGNEEFISTTSNTYTFNNLEDNKEYEITVKVKSETEEDTTTAKITTKELGTINTSITPNGYAQEKNITFELSESSFILINSTQDLTSNIEVIPCTDINTCDGTPTTTITKESWYKVNANTIFTTQVNGSIMYKLSDGVNFNEEATINVTEIDRTAPINLNVETTNTENSIIVTATAEDNESGVAYYQFSNDAGNIWTELKTTNTYTFENLTESSYDIKVRVINGTYDNEQEINVLNSIESEVKIIEMNSLQPGDAIVYGGYNWHIIREYEEDGTTYQTLLMDAGQLDKMKHCTNDTNDSTDCGVSGSDHVYSWDKSLIQTYLNNSFIQTLQSKGVDTSKIKKEQVCIDPSIGGSSTYSYGGYRKEEVDLVGGSCSKYEDYQIRLITASEYFNLSYYYRNTQLPHEGVVGSGRNSGKVAKLDGMERLDETESKIWLYSTSINSWWSMGSYSNASDSLSNKAHLVNAAGYWSCVTAVNSNEVRPVITIEK